MKTGTKFTLGLLVILFLVGLVLYMYFNPTQYFTGQRNPVLIRPPEINGEKLNHEVKVKQRKNNESFNILILGIDAREQENSRTDVIMVANVRPISKHVNILSIPRDSRVEILEIGYTKINHAHLLGEIKGGNQAGTEAALKAVSELLHVNIDYYIKINFEGFKHIVDTVGGVDIELLEPVKLTYCDITLPAGKQHIDGDLALKFVRERYSLPRGDFGRQEHQFLVLKALAHKLLEPKSISKIPALIRQVKDDILDTNFTSADVVSLAWMFKGLSSDNVSYFQIPGKKGYDIDPLVKTCLYYWLPDLELIKQGSEQYFTNIDIYGGL